MPDAKQNLDTSGYSINEIVSAWVSNALVVLMMVCLAVTVQQLGERMGGGWVEGLLPLLAAFISIEAVISFRRTRRWADLSLSGVGYYLVEWTVLLVAIKLILYWHYGFDRFFADLPRWQESFLYSFFDPDFLFLSLILFGFWLLAGSFARDLLEMEGDQEIMLGEEYVAYISDRRAIRKKLITRIFTIGFIMVFASALIRMDFQSMNPQAIPSGPLLNVVLFFILAITLLVLSHFSILRASWAMERIPVAGGMAKRWAAYSIIFLAAAALLALVLPTRYTLGLLSVFGYLLSILGFVFYLISFFIIMPVFAFISWILSLLGATGEQGPTEVQEPPPLAPDVAQFSDLPWLDILKSLLFWSIFLGVIGYALVQYLKQNEELWNRLKAIPVFDWLVDSVRWLLRGLKEANQKMGASLKAGIQRLRSQRTFAGPFTPGYLSLRRLPPREKVKFYYLALIRRSRDSGYPRRPYQSPYEFSSSLADELGEAAEDVNAMTESFVEARYSQHEISTAQAGRVKRWWEHVRQVLKGRSKTPGD